MEEGSDQCELWGGDGCKSVGQRMLRETVQGTNS